VDLHGTEAWLAHAFAYGGLAQLLAGMWEFRNRNVFGATAFSTYGAFWLGLAIYVRTVSSSATPVQVDSDQGWILLAFAIFNAYMLLWATQVNVAVFLVFLTLQATEIVLAVGNFATNTETIKVGGYVGVVTAAVAWYASAAGVINGVTGRRVLTVGSPFAGTPTTVDRAPSRTPMPQH
jgi:succinate-acetate transporter protein